MKKSILANNPLAAPGDIEEYERLLSQRFNADPNIATLPARSAPQAAAGIPAAAPALPDEVAAREARLAELNRKLFPPGQTS
ncbi:MAG: hypothetical protein ABSG68_06570 [Thermoguttaceae bacterium]